MNTQETLEKLVSFRTVAKSDDFIKIFGDDVGPHLWREFWKSYEYDVIVFYARLDNVNRAKFAKYIGA